MKFEKLGNIAEIKTGKYDVNHSTTEGMYTFYTCAMGQFKSPTYSFEGEAIILPGNGANVGQVFFTENEKFEAYQRTYVIQNIKAITKFVYYFFKSNWSRSLQNAQYGSATNYIRLNNITDFQIPILPIETQLHIANILTKSESLIAQRKESIRLLDEYLKSVFLEMFGDPVRNEKDWETALLGEICGVGSSKRVFVEELVESGIPFYRGTEIGQMAEGNEILPSLFITEEHYDQLKKHTDIPKVGDLLMPSICPDGRIYRVVDDQAFYFKDGRVLWVKVDKSDINSIYLQSVLKVIFRTNYNNIASGTTFAELKIVALKQINLPIAPLELQAQFAQIVEKTEALKAQYQQSLQELENLYGSLSQKAFKGELNLKDESLLSSTELSRSMAAEPETIYNKK